MADQTSNNQTQAQQQLAIGDTFTPPIYTDGFFSIRMLGDVVRITFFSYMASGNEKPKPVITGELAMTLPAFLKSAECVEEYIRNLEQAGVIKKSNP